MTERTSQPMYHVDSERAVISAILNDNRVLERIGANLSEADFYGPRNAKIFGAICKLVSGGDIADALTVADALATGDAAANGELQEYLFNLPEPVSSAGKAARYAETVRKLAQRRALVTAMDEGVEIAETEPDCVAAIDQITTKLTDLQRHNGSRMPRTISEIAMARVAVYEALERGETVAGWPTHIPALDSRLNGGFRPGGLYILAARPAVGKSSLAESIGMAFTGDGLPTLFCSMEMGEDEVADRGVSSAGRVSYSALLTGRMDHDGWNRAVESLEKLAKLPFHIDDQPALTLRDIRIKAKSIPGLKVLIIDYLQLMAGTRRDGNRNGEIEEISRGLKALAKELGIAVLALSQLNRDVEKRAVKRPTLSDLRDSGAIEQDADVVMFLWPVREFEGEGRKILGLGVDKNRQGRLGDMGLDFYGDTQRWQQSTADIRPTPAPRSKEL